MILITVCVYPLQMHAETPDTTSMHSTRRWDKRVHHRYEGWERFKPTHVKAQYAGGMGVLATGVGWDYGKRRQWETDFLLGYLPARYADNFRFTLTLKQNYIPWNMRLHRNWEIEPFYCGLYITTIAGEEFWEQEPGKYPNKYYNFSTKIRPYIFMGQRVNSLLNKPIAKSITLYYEVSTCELYVISKVSNRSLSMRDILRFSFGAKLQLFKD